jgi:hypothetical protein
MNVSRSAVARFLECDDVMGHFLGFVGDQHKVAVMSLVNKAFARLTQDAGSWKWGSDGFIVATDPTRERLRLLRVVHGRTEVSTSVLSDCCPSLVSFYPSNDLPADVCDVLAKRLQSYSTPCKTALMGALEKARAPQLHTLSNFGPRVDLEAFPALTDLTASHLFKLMPALSLVAPRLVRLVVNTLAIDAKSFAVETSAPWNLREFILKPGGGMNNSVIFDLVVRVGTLCPYLVSLAVCDVVTWSCTHIRQIAHATPMLERVTCGYIDTNGNRLHAAADMWPRLESLTITDTSAYVLRHLANPHLLRCLSSPHPCLADNVYLLRAVIELAPPLTSFNICTGVFSSSASVAFVSTAIAVIGATLETLTADVGFVSVGRYCPRLRRLRRSRYTRKWKETPAHLQRGCPLLEDYDVKF